MHRCHLPVADVLRDALGGFSQRSAPPCMIGVYAPTPSRGFLSEVNNAR